MKRQTLLFAPLALLLLFLVACSNTSNIPVPADAAFVIHVNGASLQSKLSWDEIKQSDWFRIANEKTKDSLARTVLNDPDASGIDTKGDMYIFFKNRGRGGYGAVVGNVKEEKAFAAFMEKSMEGKKASSEKGLSVIRNEKSVLTWKEKRFVFVFDNPEMNSNAAMMGGQQQDTGDRSFSSDSLLYFASEIYGIKGKSSVGSNSRFSGMMKEKGDVHFWFNASGMYGGAMPAMLALTKVNLLLKDNVTAATLNFDNGKITVDAKSYYNKELEALYKKYKPNNIDDAIYKKIPSQNVAALVAMTYPPEGLKEFITLLGADGLVNMMLAQETFTLNDFIKANKGDLLIAVTDFGMRTDTMRMEGLPEGMQMPARHKADAKFLFAVSVNDKEAFNKMINLVQGKISKGGDQMTAMMNHIPYQLKDNWFVAGNDSVAVNAFGNTATEQSFISKISGHPMAGFIDIQKFISGARPSMDSTAAFIADQALKTWQDMIFYGGEFRDNAALSHLEINMVDKNTNSLKQLNSFLGVVAKTMDEKEKLREQRYQDLYENKVDTTAVPPSPNNP
ncbi:MAG TPA: DUF4836 family protein [Chitinophagaceae bacterium]|nr:DUF4836 family protein [Chitinophagaceae bacterium]